MALFQKELWECLTHYENLIHLYKQQLENAPHGSLLSQPDRNGRNQFLLSYTENGKRVRKGINNDEEIKRALARREFAKKALEILEPNVEMLRSALEGVIPFDPDSIIQEMTKAYALLPEEYFFDRELIATTLDLEEADKIRIARHELWGEEPYKVNMFHAENKVMRSSRGEMLRSKSELLIAESLYHYGIPFHYDEVWVINGVEVLPDFSFKDAYDDPFFWEHLGMMNNPQYARHNLNKMNQYYDVGIIPGSNLILSFDGNGTINMGMIDAIIRNEIIPRL